MVLIYNKNKIHVNQKEFVKDLTLHKYDYLFDIITLTKNNVWALQVWKKGYKHELTFFNTHFIYKKATITQNI